MSDDVKHPARETPIACNLVGEDQVQRREELARDLFSGRQQTIELESGYEFVFPGEAEWAQRLVDFVLFERECCPFLVFTLEFEADGGPVSLRVRGPEGTKEFAGEMFAEECRG